MKSVFMALMLMVSTFAVIGCEASGRVDDDGDTVKAKVEIDD